MIQSSKEAFDFIQRLGIVDSICVGMKSSSEVDCNVNLIEGRNVPRETLVQISEVLGICPEMVRTRYGKYQTGKLVNIMRGKKRVIRSHMNSQ
jgi:hypothetical protein